MGVMPNGYVPMIEIPKEKVLDVRYRVKQLTAQRQDN